MRFLYGHCSGTSNEYIFWFIDFGYKKRQECSVYQLTWYAYIISMYHQMSILQKLPGLKEEKQKIDSLVGLLGKNCSLENLVLHCDDSNWHNQI